MISGPAGVAGSAAAAADVRRFLERAVPLRALLVVVTGGSVISVSSSIVFGLLLDAREAMSSASSDAFLFLSERLPSGGSLSRINVLKMECDPGAIPPRTWGRRSLVSREDVVERRRWMDSSLA